MEIGSKRLLDVRGVPAGVGRSRRPVRRAIVFGVLPRQVPVGPRGTRHIETQAPALIGAPASRQDERGLL